MAQGKIISASNGKTSVSWVEAIGNDEKLIDGGYLLGDQEITNEIRNAYKRAKPLEVFPGITYYFSDNKKANMAASVVAVATQFYGGRITMSDDCKSILYREIHNQGGFGKKEPTHDNEDEVIY